MEHFLSAIGMKMNSWWGIRPNHLTYFRIFAAPWLAMLVAETLSRGDMTLGLVTIAAYLIVVATDSFDGPLARALQRNDAHSHDLEKGGVLDRLSDKILIILVLIPFGFNPWTSTIILVESALAFEALFGSAKDKKAAWIGKTKMMLETLLLPVLIAHIFISTNTFSVFATVFFAVTALFAVASLVSHIKR